jgi:mannose/fructose/N-acetylgalactosamine-specific phosphotransferase system component IIB
VVLVVLVVLGTPFLVSVRHCLRLVDAFNEIGLLGAGNTENTSMTKKEKGCNDSISLDGKDGDDTQTLDQRVKEIFIS